MKNMFNNCFNIETLNLTNFTSEKCKSFDSMFESCYNLTVILDIKDSNKELRNNIPDYVKVIVNEKE